MYILYHSSLIVVSHVAHLPGQTVDTGEGFAEATLAQELIVGIIPGEVVFGFPSCGASGAQNLIAYQLQAWWCADGSLLAPIYDLALVGGVAQVVVLTFIYIVVIDTGASGMMVVPPPYVVESGIVGHQVQLEVIVGLSFGVLAVARVVGQDARRIQSVSHLHLTSVFGLRRRSALVVQVVDDERWVRAVAANHACQLLVAIIEVELSIESSVIKLACGILVSTRLLEIEQSQFVSGIEYIGVADGAVKVEHRHAQLFGVTHLLVGQFLGRRDAVVGPEAPRYGGHEGDALAVEVELFVAPHRAHLEPTEAKTLLHLVVAQPQGQFVQVGGVDTPQSGLWQ